MINIGMKFTLLLTVLIITAVLGCASRPMQISCQARVPNEFKKDPPGWVSPTGEPESVRYTKSYEAFWWNCVMVKAVSLEGRCPSTCSGTPAANYGCSDGAMDAERQIRQLLKLHDKTKVQDYLRTVAPDQEGKEKIRPYFPDGPRAEEEKRGRPLSLFYFY
jgi:hypothetical protein